MNNTTTTETTYIKNRELYDIIIYIINGLIMLFFGVIQYQIKRYFKKTDITISQIKADVEVLSMASERNNHRTSINEPIEPSDDGTPETHRDVKLNNGTIIRVHY